MVDFPFDLSKLDMGSIMNMARDIKEQMARVEEQLAAIEVEAIVGGGMVSVKANAKGEILSLKIEDELIEMNDKPLLENLTLTGVNQALLQARQRREEEMQKMTGGLFMPGMFT